MRTAQTLIEGFVQDASNDPPVAPTADQTASDSATRLAGGSAGLLAAGQLFHGDFRIEDAPVKFGGMGEVYKATNIINGATVAIKLIRHELSHDPELVKRFRDEDNALRLLNNSAIVRYFGVRREPHLDRLYIVMEYVDGPSLGEYINRHGALSKDDIEYLCRRLVDGLQDAHAQGIIHRDLSPDNILLENGMLRQAKIIDFGIAKVKVNEDFTTFRTSFVGKFAYASPEHFSQTAQVDEKSDIYSLGLILAAAARAKPLDMGTDQLSGAAARQRIPDLTDTPAGLRPLLSRMLDPKPAVRPIAAEIARTLQPPSVNSNSGGGRRRAPAVLGILLLAVCGVVGYKIWLDKRADTLGNTIAQTGGKSPVDAEVANPAASNVSPQKAAETLNQAIHARPPTCAPLYVSALTDRILLYGLAANPVDYQWVKDKANQIGAPLEDHVAISEPACKTLRLLNALGWTGVGRTKGRPGLEVDRAPPVFTVGETVTLTKTIDAINGRHIYHVIIDDKGGATVTHSFERSFARVPSSAPVKEPGWYIVVLISAENDIGSLDTVGAATIDGLNEALAAIIGFKAGPTDTLAAVQVIYRTSARR
jgi:serine/threonine protein kinase